MDTVLGVYSCIAQDRDHAEKKKRWSTTRCVNLSKRYHNRQLLSSSLYVTHGSWNRGTRDQYRSMTIPTSSVPAVVGSWERRSIREESRWTQNRCQLKIEAWIFHSGGHMVTAGQSPRVELSLQQPAALAAQPRKRSFVLRVARNVDYSYGLWRYWRQSDNRRLSFTSLRPLQAPSSKNIL